MYMKISSYYALTYNILGHGLLREVIIVFLAQSQLTT